jgi:phosphomannomutase
MQKHIFRTYDIRGIVGKDLALEDVFIFGCALATYFIQRNPAIKTVVVGMDGRVHSKKIMRELVDALLDSGLNVQFIGVCPTPVLYFALHKTNADAGVMITASHNEKEYNGFKICCDKQMVWGDEIAKLYELYSKSVYVPAVEKGSFIDSLFVPIYLDWLEQEFAHLKGAKCSVVFDCVNGAAATVVPELVSRMGWRNAFVVNGVVNGKFPNCAPDPTTHQNKEFLARSIEQNQAQLGIGFDGDADRMVPMSSDGRSLTGDLVLALFAESMVQQNPKITVAFDGKCSLVLHQLLKQWGVAYRMSPTGIAMVKQTMREAGAVLAGELSCHFIFADRYFGYDDGIYAALRLLEILEKTGKKLDVLVDRFPTTFTTGEVRIPCIEEHKQDIVKAVHEKFKERNGFELHTLDGVRVTTDYGWGIVRVSNTQPVISFSCEAPTQEGFEKIKFDFSQALTLAYQQNSIPIGFDVEHLEHQ